MKKRPEVLAIVPARSGSKSIPRKNIHVFAGHPLIAYSIAAAQKSEKVTRLIVSTDDEEIAEVARYYGGEVPFLRPVELAQDETPDLPVFQHALDWLGCQENYFPDVIVHLRPTSPIRPHDCVDRAIRILLEHPEADSIRSVIPSGQNPYKMWCIDSITGQMKPLLHLSGVHEAYNTPRQQLPVTYWQTGHVDVIRTATILKKNSMSGEVILPLITDPCYAMDIDTRLEWQFAEFLIQKGALDIIKPDPKPVR